jgi:aryl-alcohol dehydrogenase-like predicted oxidoreductase
VTWGSCPISRSPAACSPANTGAIHFPDGSRLATPRPHETRFREQAGWATIDTLEAFCAARGRTLLELAFGWLLARPVTASVIAGATTPAQIEQNCRAASWVLTSAELAEVDRLTSCDVR